MGNVCCLSKRQPIYFCLPTRHSHVRGRAFTEEARAVKPPYLKQTFSSLYLPLNLLPPNAVRPLGQQIEGTLSSPITPIRNRRIDFVSFIELLLVWCQWPTSENRHPDRIQQRDWRSFPGCGRMPPLFPSTHSYPFFRSFDKQQRSRCVPTKKGGR